MCLFKFVNKGKISGKRKERNVQRWTKKEMEKFPQVLAYPFNGLAFCLDKLALKKSYKKDI